MVLIVAPGPFVILGSLMVLIVAPGPLVILGSLMVGRLSCVPVAHSSLIVVPGPIVVSKLPCGPKDPW